MSAQGFKKNKKVGRRNVKFKKVARYQLPIAVSDCKKANSTFKSYPSALSQQVGQNETPVAPEFTACEDCSDFPHSRGYSGVLPNATGHDSPFWKLSVKSARKTLKFPVTSSVVKLLSRIDTVSSETTIV
jgi:hypothetical protein